MLCFSCNLSYGDMSVFFIITLFQLDELFNTSSKAADSDKDAATVVSINL